MTLVIELTKEEADRLSSAARREGLEPAELAHRIITADLEPELSPKERHRRRVAMERLVAESERLQLYR